MKNIKIKCYIENNLLFHDFQVLIYQNNTVIYECPTKNNELSISLPFGIYKVFVYSKLIPIFNECKTIYVSKHSCVSQINFIFKENQNPRKTTFILTDRYYLGLPIEKGEINLWPNPM